MSPTESDQRGPRIAGIDALRGLAIAAMVVYHFSWDLSFFGLYSVNVMTDPGWKVFARTIAGSFIALVGVSLVLSTRKGFFLRPYLRRLAIIVGAALLVTIGTWYWAPQAFVFFGILHLIAFASVAALPFLRLPTLVVFIAAVVILALPFFYTSPLFDNPLLWWVGFTPQPPSTVDYVPVFPWFAMALLGIVAGRLFLRYGGDSAFARWAPSDWLGRTAVVAGRWSLLIYLVHQPLLIGLITPFAPPARTEAQVFTEGCVTTCRANGQPAPFCELTCNCVLTGIEKEGYLSEAVAGRMTPEQNDHWINLVRACVAQETPAPPGAGDATPAAPEP